MLEQQKLSVNGKDVVIRADRELFARLLIIREKRGISIKELLKYSLGPIAWSLATPQGNIFKSVKSKLLKALEEKITFVDHVPQESARVYDGMCIVQQVPTGFEVFGQLSDYILKRITSNPSTNIFFTTDQYWDASIKSCERSRRANSGLIRITASRRDQKLPKQFKKYLAVGENKQELIEFLLADWSTQAQHHHQISEKTIFFTTKKDAFKIKVLEEETQCQPVDQLSSNQEEADTKMFLALKVAQEAGCSDAVIYTVDSDVAILALYYARRLSIHLFLQLGTGSDVRILDTQATDWLSDLLEALPSLHAISGCDSVSAFHGLGKGKWLSTLSKKEEYVEAMRLLGESLQINENLFCTIERMVCHLYGMPEEHDIDNARYKIFCRSKTPEPYQLPPTKDDCFNILREQITSLLFGNRL